MREKVQLRGCHAIVPHITWKWYPKMNRGYWQVSAPGSWRKMTRMQQQWYDKAVDWANRENRKETQFTERRKPCG